MFIKNNILSAIFISLVITGLCAACTSSAHPQPTAPVEVQSSPAELTQTPTPEIEPTLSFVTHEGARDIAARYLAEKYSLESPTDWIVDDKTPQNLVGSSAYQYTSGAWVVHVQAPVVAPEYLLYSVKVDHIASGLHWEGEVTADGTLIEKMITPPAQVLTPEDARNAVVEYLLAHHGWHQPVEWVEQEARPLENAVTRYTYTSGSWVVQVDAPAAAPIVPEYFVTADHMAQGVRWIGEVDASGEIREETYITS